MIIKKLIIFLAVINLIGTITQYFNIIYTPTILEHVIVWGLALSLIFIAIVSFIPSSVKAIIVIGIIYIAVIKQFRVKYGLH